ncbi:MAG: hypothetical protein JST81_07515 [Bacteroidetes bacterium]|nr:hypothetical protein [Bacteroidota bacterium]
MNSRQFFMGMAVVVFAVLLHCKSIAQSMPAAVKPIQQEKIFVHFDKPFYTAGESIWFKAYLYSNGHPSLMSDELYLQLENASGIAVLQQKYPIIGATVPGQLILPDSLPQGYYSVKATTKTIANHTPDFTCNRNVFVFNNAYVQKTPEKKSAVLLQFFPESGHLIDKIRTQVAFKATDESGNPVDVSGVIRSDSTNVVAEFRSLHDGIGKTSFTPHTGDSLVAEIVFNGKTFKFSLPPVILSGVNLSVKDGDTAKTYTVTRSRNEAVLFDTVRMIVKLNNDTVYESRIGFGNDRVLSGTLSTKNIRSGILHFILLSGNNVPLAERLSFVNNREYLLTPELLELKRDSSKKGYNNFSIQFKDSVQRSFSVAVTDGRLFDYPDKENICSGLLLSSDIRGNIFNPGYYFESDDAIHRLALDNLLLTQGWTRYNWTSSQLSNNSSNEPGHFLLSLSGTVVHQGNNKPAGEGLLTLTIITGDSAMLSVEAKVDAEGKFTADSLLFYGTAKAFYSYITLSGKRIPVNIELNKEQDFYFPGTPVAIATGISTGRDQTPAAGFTQCYVQTSYFEGKYKQLETVFLKAKFKRPEDKLNEKYASAVFRNTGKLVVDNINHPVSNPSIDVINYALLNIRNLAYDNDQKSLVNRKNFSLQTKKNWMVETIVDEAVSNVEIARTITMDKVAMIKFYETGFIGVGTQAPGGALAIYLKKYDDIQTPDPGKKYLLINGYTMVQDFYNPNYSTPAFASIPDERSTLYWNTTVTNSPNTSVSFYNNDYSKKLSLVVQGFDATGKLIYLEKLIN